MSDPILGSALVALIGAVRHLRKRIISIGMHTTPCVLSSATCQSTI